MQFGTNIREKVLQIPITIYERAWPIHFVILAFCDNNVGDLSFFSFFSEQSLFRIQTRHFWSFLLRLVVALTKSAPAFLLIENIKIITC